VPFWMRLLAFIERHAEKLDDLFKRFGPHVFFTLRSRCAKFFRAILVINSRASFSSTFCISNFANASSLTYSRYNPS
jgi:hypothetical protein